MGCPGDWYICTISLGRGEDTCVASLVFASVIVPVAREGTKSSRGRLALSESRAPRF